MNKKILKAVQIGLIVLLSIVIAFLVIRSFSLPLALSFGGFKPNAEFVLAPTGTTRYEQRQFIQNTVSEGGKDLTVLYTSTKDGQNALVALEKNGLGFWCISDSAVLKEDDKFVSLQWLTGGNVEFLSQEAAPQAQADTNGMVKTVSSEKNTVIMGNNAIDDIDNLLYNFSTPKNYYYKVYQNGSFYIVYEVCQRSSSPQDVYDILVNVGCVPKS